MPSPTSSWITAALVAASALGLADAGIAWHEGQRLEHTLTDPVGFDLGGVRGRFVGMEVHRGLFDTTASGTVEIRTDAGATLRAPVEVTAAQGLARDGSTTRLHAVFGIPDLPLLADLLHRVGDDHPMSIDASSDLSGHLRSRVEVVLAPVHADVASQDGRHVVADWGGAREEIELGRFDTPEGGRQHGSVTIEPLQIVGQGGGAELHVGRSSETVDAQGNPDNVRGRFTFHNDADAFGAGSTSVRTVAIDAAGDFAVRRHGGGAVAGNPSGLDADGLQLQLHEMNIRLAQPKGAMHVDASVDMPIASDAGAPRDPSAMRALLRQARVRAHVVADADLLASLPQLRQRLAAPDGLLVARADGGAELTFVLADGQASLNGRAVSPAAPPLGAPPTAFGTPDTGGAAAMIRRNIIAPDPATVARDPEVEVGVQIDPRDGRVVSATIARSSGDASWDNAVLLAVTAIDRLPPLPQGGWSQDVTVRARPQGVQVISASQRQAPVQSPMSGGANPALDPATSQVVAATAAPSPRSQAYGRMVGNLITARWHELRVQQERQAMLGSGGQPVPLPIGRCDAELSLDAGGRIAGMTNLLCDPTSIREVFERAVRMAPLPPFGAPVTVHLGIVSSQVTPGY